MGILQHGAAIPSGASAYNIDNSLKLERGNSEKLSRTPSSASNSKTWTYSFWLKRTQLGINSYHLEAKGSGDRFFILGFNENDNLVIYDIYSDDYGKVLRMKFRDTAAWYHIVLAIDTTDGTAGNRNKFYVNGALVTDYVTDYGDFPQNHDTQINKAVVHNIGYRTDINQYASGYIAETCFIDGAALAPTSFGEFDDNGIWIPKDPSALTFGTNGFYQEYKSSSALGADTVPGGNSNDYAASNIAAADQSTDTPTNNFCTWNPLWQYKYMPTITEGATKVRYTDSTDENAKATIGLTNGKWYWEAKPVGTIGSQYIGIQTDGDSNLNSAQGLLLNYTMAINPTGKYYSFAGSLSESADQGWDLVASDWLGIALDMDSSTQTIKYYKNGSLIQSVNLISQMQGETVFPFLQNYENRSWDVNFGGYTINTISSAASDANGYGTFEYAPPSGYYAICTKNLAEFG